MIYAFDHAHNVGDVCSRKTCEAVRRAPTLSGSEVFDDIPMLILRPATIKDYLGQEIPEGWILPEPHPLNKYFYEISSD